MYPVIPHIINECVESNNFEPIKQWPEVNKSLLDNKTVSIVVQIDGKKRGVIVVDKDTEEKTVMELARNQGSSLAKEYGSDVSAFLETLKFWTQGGALEIDLLEKSETKLDFNVTRCRYAEMYKALGIQDLGAVLSCNRDAAMIEGFNEGARLDRKTTIMGGGECCTFRYTFDNPNEQE